MKRETGEQISMELEEAKKAFKELKKAFKKLNDRISMIIQVIVDNQAAQSGQDPRTEYEQGVNDGLELALEIITGELERKAVTAIQLHKKEQQ